ncbi:MAG: FtsX-like permease family protein, partial [Marinoscillum sp.]
NYLDNLNHKLLAGSNFSNNNSKDGIIVNETFLKKFGIQSPEEALGKRIHYYQSNKTIIGVVADFNYGTIYTRIEPFAFLYNTERLEHLNLKIQSSNIIETMDKLDKIWRQIDPHHELNATFYDVQIQGFYKHMEAKMKMYGMLALIAISIAMLGLLGMVVYTTESRLKEITIRKVLGASLSNLIILVGRSFSWIFLIATSIAIPASYYVYQELMGSAAHSVDINPFQLAFGAIPIIVISLLVVFGQSLKAAHTNPADTLRNE